MSKPLSRPTVAHRCRPPQRLSAHRLRKGEIARYSRPRAHAAVTCAIFDLWPFQLSSSLLVLHTVSHHAAHRGGSQATLYMVPAGRHRATPPASFRCRAHPILTTRPSPTSGSQRHRPGYHRLPVLHCSRGRSFSAASRAPSSMVGVRPTNTATPPTSFRRRAAPV